MPPREIKPEDYALVKEMYATFQAAHSGPAVSFSDFQVGFTGLLKMFEIKRRALPYDPYGTKD